MAENKISSAAVCRLSATTKDSVSHSLASSLIKSKIDQIFFFSRTMGVFRTGSVFWSVFRILGSSEDGSRTHHGRDNR